MPYDSKGNYFAYPSTEYEPYDPDGRTMGVGNGNGGWICDLIASHYFPGLNLNHAELAADVNRFFQGLGKSVPTGALDYTEFASRKASRTGDPRRLKAVFSAARKLYWAIYDANPEFWQTQFSRKSFIANLLVKFIALVASRTLYSSSSARLFQQLREGANAATIQP